MKKSYYVYNNGTLKRKDNSMVFINEEGEKRYIPIETVDEIYVMGEMELNTKLINFFSQHGITAHFFQLLQFLFREFLSKRKIGIGKTSCKTG